MSITNSQSQNPNQSKQSVNASPYVFYEVQYEGDVEDFKKLLKKKISFDIKDMGNQTIYLKVKREDYEKFMLFIQATSQKSSIIKKYEEITQDIYKGALLSLDNILHGK